MNGRKATGISADWHCTRRPRPMSYDVMPDIAVVGGGPAGLSAALAAGESGARVLLIDRQDRLGGQLIKQTHKFFGSKKEYAGTRGIEIAVKLAEKLRSLPNVEVWLSCTALGYYPDGALLVEKPDGVFVVKAKRYVFCTGASERFVLFPNNDLPGIYGAGAVQTLMNVEGVLPGKKVVMLGAGNIGLIVSYQLLQAGAEVLAVVEAMPTIGGYAVHASKIRRLGVPILTRHTVVRARGREHLEAVTIGELDDGMSVIPGTERDIEADVLCVAVGLSPLAELLWQAGCEMRYIPELGGHVPLLGEDMQTTVPGIYAAGDLASIEEASSAMAEGRLAGAEAARSLGFVKAYEANAYGAREALASLRAGPKSEKIRVGLEKLRALNAAKRQTVA